jgi:mannitol/fructose-specific phosphotransferase system IIA component (Ntr-type)
MKTPAISGQVLGAVRLALEATTPPAAIAELASALPAGGRVRDPQRLLAEALAREGEGTTWLGRGLALPHARTDAVAGIIAAAGRSGAGIPWGPAGERASFVVLIGVPKAKVRDYLEFVRRLTVAMRDETRARSLLEAPGEQAFRDAWQAAMEA